MGSVSECFCQLFQSASDVARLGAVHLSGQGQGLGLVEGGMGCTRVSREEVDPSLLTEKLRVLAGLTYDLRISDLKKSPGFFKCASLGE